MSEKPTYQRKCEALKQLMLKLPEKQGLSLKEAGRMSKINFYKYKPDGSIPLTLSLISFGEAFGIGPDWIFRIALMVESNQLTEAKALEILLRWPEFKPAFESAVQIALNEVDGKLKG